MLNDYINNLNGIQRVGLFIWGLLVLSMLVLHNPINGYSDLTYNINKNGELVRFDSHSYVLGNAQFRLVKECQPILQQVKGEDIAYPEKSEVLAKLRKLGCFDNHVRPFSEWQSTNPILPWFGSVVNLLWSLFFSSIAVILFLYLFKDLKKIGKEKKN